MREYILTTLEARKLEGKKVERMSCGICRGHIKMANHHVIEALRVQGVRVRQRSLDSAKVRTCHVQVTSALDR